MRGMLQNGKHPSDGAPFARRCLLKWNIIHILGRRVPFFGGKGTPKGRPPPITNRILMRQENKSKPPPLPGHGRSPATPRCTIAAALSGSDALLSRRCFTSSGTWLRSDFEAQMMMVMMMMMMMIMTTRKTAREMNQKAPFAGGAATKDDLENNTKCATKLGMLCHFKLCITAYTDQTVRSEVGACQPSKTRHSAKQDSLFESGSRSASRQVSHSSGHGSKARTRSKHPNPTTKIGSKMDGAPTPKWDPIGFDPQPPNQPARQARPARQPAASEQESQQANEGTSERASEGASEVMPPNWLRKGNNAWCSCSAKLKLFSANQPAEKPIGPTAWRPAPTEPTWFSDQRSLLVQSMFWRMLMCRC